jgi:uncharacterized ferritin-like protein (DUF455 family)
MVKKVKIAPVVTEIVEVKPTEKKVKKVKKVKTDEVKKVKKTNPWLIHIAEFRKINPTLSYKDCLKEGKKTYVKGGVSIPAKPVPIKKAPADSIKKVKKVKKAVKKETKPKQTPDK